MTDTKALEALIEMVQAGEAQPEGIAVAAFDVQPYLTPQRGQVADAYHGSLDAAKALHEALLPFTDVDVNIRLVLCDITVYLGDDTKDWHSSSMQCPARAWLLAILRAKLSETQQKGGDA